MKQTAIQQAIAMVRNRIESIDETLMGKHTIHHLQQVERGLHDLLEVEKEQIKESWIEGGGYSHLSQESDRMLAEQYYNETYNDNK
jgi:chaperonin GroEL (HSP60 family)